MGLKDLLGMLQMNAYKKPFKFEKARKKPCKVCRKDIFSGNFCSDSCEKRYLKHAIMETEEKK
jgi:hypothetical protein